MMARISSLVKPILVAAVCLGLAWAYGAYREAKGYDRAVIEQSAASARTMAKALIAHQKMVDDLQAGLDDEKRRSAMAIDGRNSAVASERRLRQRIEQMAANARRENPDLAQGGPATGSAIDLLAHMLSRSIDVSGRLAEHADAARNAGLTCEAAYDTVEKSLSSMALSRLGRGE